MMRRFLLLAGLLAATPAAAQNQDFSLIERGRYLTGMGDCVACHSAPGGKPFAGGRTIETPFGNLLSPNLTPDRETGLGAWTDAEFLRAMHEGRGRAGEHLYPAFPYAYYTRVSDADVLAIHAYLATLEPVVNKVVSNQLPFPFNVRASLIAWNALNFTPGRFQPDSSKSAEWNRGAYLVGGLEHCGLCHTPKGVSGGDKTGRFLQGNELQGWYAPNITGDLRRGVGSWSVDAIAEYLRSGHNAAAAASGPMAEMVEESGVGLDEPDLRAIAVYLKDLPGQPEAAPALPAAEPSMQVGAAIYVDECAACHNRAGTGVPRLFPALKGAPTVQQDNPQNLVRVVLQGAQSSQNAYAVTGPAMPALGWKLSDAQVADTVTFIRNTWGNAAPPVSAADVASIRAELAQRTN